MLRLTHILQPLLIALLLTEAIRARKEGFEPDFFAGHSLGELAAWASAGAMTPEDAVEITAVRGRAMEQVADMHEGDMLALTNTDEDQVQRMLAIGQEHGQITCGSIQCTPRNRPDWNASGTTSRCPSFVNLVV